MTEGREKNGSAEVCVRKEKKMACRKVLGPWEMWMWKEGGCREEKERGDVVAQAAQTDKRNTRFVGLLRSLLFL